MKLIVNDSFTLPISNYMERFTPPRTLIVDSYDTSDKNLDFINDNLIGKISVDDIKKIDIVNDNGTSILSTTSYGHIFDINRRHISPAAKYGDYESILTIEFRI